MKRILAILLTALLLVGLLTGCAAPANKTEPAEAETPAPEATPEPAETPAPEATPEPVETPAPEAIPDDTPVSPLMWKVTDVEGHTLYLFGTIHVGDERNERVLERIAPVLESCDALAVEFDIVAYGADVNAMMEDMAQFVLTDGSTITDYMPEELYDEVCDLLSQVGLMPGLFKRYNLSMWSQLVDEAMRELYCPLETDFGMDNLLIHHAYDRGIPVLNVESAAFQMELLNSFPDELNLLKIREELDTQDTYGDDLTELYELWLSGDREEFWTMLEGETTEEEDGEEYTEEQIAMIEDYNRAMLDDRNLGMAERAKEYLASGQTVFFAVGAAHMANEPGLVQLLTDAGYTVEAYEY
ncbi:MAG: TraB/GumN family protein [Oscillospiraceae bacterium]|nr:TraB/GumN family protein [Oscillospiraceae bacterium]